MPVSKHWKENPDKYKEYLLERNFGISLEEYKAMLEAQNNACAICHKANGSDRHKGDRTKQLSVDHNHITGALRGLLCNDCNRGIGQLKDDPILLERAAKYLRNYEAKHVKTASIAEELLAEMTSL